jgi:hypothetical protein
MVECRREHKELLMASGILRPLLRLAQRQDAAVNRYAALAVAGLAIGPSLTNTLGEGRGCRRLLLGGVTSATMATCFKTLARAAAAEFDPGHVCLLQEIRGLATSNKRSLRPGSFHPSSKWFDVLPCP